MENFNKKFPFAIELEILTLKNPNCTIQFTLLPFENLIINCENSRLWKMNKQNNWRKLFALENNRKIFQNKQNKNKTTNLNEDHETSFRQHDTDHRLNIARITIANTQIIVT